VNVQSGEQHENSRAGCGSAAGSATAWRYRLGGPIQQPTTYGQQLAATTSEARYYSYLQFHLLHETCLQRSAHQGPLSPPLLLCSTVPDPPATQYFSPRPGLAHQVRQHCLHTCTRPVSTPCSRQPDVILVAFLYNPDCSFSLIHHSPRHFPEGIPWFRQATS
jgi:hypothetical protein